MKFLGLVEVADFARRHPGEAETLWAWVAEIRNHSWESVGDLSASFRSVDIAKLPEVIFRLGDTPLKINTLINLRKGILLLTSIDLPAIALRSITLHQGNA